jgi:hypothetical protein
MAAAEAGAAAQVGTLFAVRRVHNPLPSLRHAFVYSLFLPSPAGERGPAAHPPITHPPTDAWMQRYVAKLQAVLQAGPPAGWKFRLYLSADLAPYLLSTLSQYLLTEVCIFV